MEESARSAALQLAEEIRDACPDMTVITHCGGGSFKSQFKKADRSGADWALVLGEQELESGQVVLKPLRDRAEQISIARSDLVQQLRCL
jgi:histidyl-tRNA synthetase